MAPTPSLRVYHCSAFELRAEERRLIVAGADIVLGKRAFDLLLMLVEEQPRVVSKDELLARVWPRMVVEENNLTVQMSTLRKHLGPDVIATVPGLGYRLAVPLKSPPPRADAAASEHAAAQPTARNHDALLGRSAELGLLQAALLQHRLVTVVGLGGVGKTALARACWQACRPDPDGLTGWAELAPLHDGALVCGQAAAALGLTPAQAVGALALAAAIESRPALLVLDNCEHLMADVSAFVAELLAHAPAARVLATSQVPLRLPGEHVVRLAPLAVPALRAPAAQARLSGAVALFEARAVAHDARFVLDERNLAAVVDICRQLDGVPLAIELAASRVRLLGAEGLRSRLNERMRLLSGTVSDDARHRTVRAALDWSHALLSDDEQALFARLCVFAGGFSLPALQHVASDERLDEWVVLDLLGQLVERSLVVTAQDGAAARAAGVDDAQAGEPRYHLLETLRQYSAEQLRARGDMPLWRRRHALYFREFAATHGTPTTALRSPADRWPLMLEHDNLRVALDWMAEHEPARALDTAAALGPFWRERGHHDEAQRRIDGLLAHSQNRLPCESGARARIVLCALANERGQDEVLRARAGEVLVDARALGSRVLESLGHIWLAHAHEGARDLAGAEAAFRDALVIVRELGDPARVAETLCNIASILILRGQAAESVPLLNEALQLYRAERNLWGQGFAESTLAEAAFASGAMEVALAHAEAALAHHRRLQHRHRLCYSLVQCGTTLLRLGRLAGAWASLDECLNVAVAHGFDEYITDVLVQAALLAGARDAPERAARLLGAAQGQINRGADEMDAARSAEFERAQRQLSALMEPLAWARNWALGRALRRDDAVAQAWAHA